MKLNVFLETHVNENGKFVPRGTSLFWISHWDFGKVCNVHPATVQRWASDNAMPSPENLKVIREVTDGKVTPNDFI